MLVLALERATDGHDSLDCQMALRKKKKLQISKQVTAFRKYSTKEITIMRRKKNHESILLTISVMVHQSGLYNKMQKNIQ